MIERIFKGELEKIQCERELIFELWNEIVSCYSETNRYYHNLSHLENLIHELNQCKDLVFDWQTMIWAVVYHDIIYDVQRNSNEEESAMHAMIRLSQLSVPQTQRDQCERLILATKTHSLSKDMDTNYFIDADLSILGSDSSRYKQYSVSIRKEYQFYPDTEFKLGRQRVLEFFLGMPNIFKTQYFQDKYENQARKNLEWELFSLKA